MSPPFVITTSMWQYYLDIWKELFHELLGWSEAETLRWAERWKDVVTVDDPDDIFYHESPVYWARGPLIPDTLRDRLSKTELLDLNEKLLHAFWDEWRHHFPPGTDWRPYRDKVERILAEYGGSLPVTPAA